MSEIHIKPCRFAVQKTLVLMRLVFHQMPMYCVNNAMQASKFLFRGMIWMKKSTIKFVLKNY